jgi:hypothetical protein
MFNFASVPEAEGKAEGQIVFTSTVSSTDVKSQFENFHTAD